jgi:Inhibitor of Apoptosis domain
MASLEARLASFDKWPKDKRQTPSDLAEAGFFHTGKEDEVLCFHCDGGLKEWADCDEPWVLHAKWFSVCAFLQRKMGKSFITSVQRVHKPLMSLKVNIFRLLFAH